MSTASERAIVFACGEQRLVGVLHAPDASGRPGVLVVVGGPQYRAGSHRQFVILARSLARAGYPVFRFDFRGMGDSDGAARTFEAVGEDIRAAIDTFVREVPELPGIVLWGLCDAASASLMYCAGDARVGGLILVNPWVRTEAGEARSYLQNYYLRRILQTSFWRKLLGGQFRVIASSKDFLGKVRLAARAPSGAPADTRTGFIDRMLDGLRAFAGPTLLVISGRDLVAGTFTALTSASASWRRALAQPRVQQFCLPNADHTFSTRADLERVNYECIRWLDEISYPGREHQSALGEWTLERSCR